MDAQGDDSRQLIRLLSHALRHSPDEHFLDMDSEGWADIDDVLLAVRCHKSRWRDLSRADLFEVATTAFGNRFNDNGWLNPIATLPHTIYTYAISPYEDWHNQAWAAALILMLFVFLVNVTARVWLRPSSGTSH